MTAPLPRSLDPLPDESLPGYLLRLAHRLDLSPARLAQITGLSAYSQGARVAAMLALPSATATRFADATRLTLAEVTSLTLDPLSSRYPPLAPVLAGRRRQGSGLFVKETWVFSQHTRYCPHCLAGDGSLIQQRHGGGWSKLWRLAVTFACPTHQRLLEHACPNCHTPALARGKGLAMLPRVGDSTLHPTGCRGLTKRGPEDEICRQRLDQAPPTDHDVDLPALLALQNQLLDLLQPGGATGTTSVCQPTTPARYFIDLRILACLITASWPIAEPLVRDRRHAGLLDDHVDQIRRQIAHDDKRRGQPRHNALYDTPPTSTATAAILLAAADAIANAGDADAVRDILGPMFEAHPRGRPWARQYLRGDGYCSPGLQDAIGPEIGSLHIMRRTGVPHHTTRRWRLPPPLPVSFHVGHIPQRPPREWMQTFFSDFTDLAPQLLADVVVIRLAHACLGTTTRDVAARLGIPQPAATRAFRIINRALAVSGRHAAFDQAIHDLAGHLDSSAQLTDYGKRRDALTRWRISRPQWRSLIADMPAQPVRGTGPVPPTQWRDSKRILATVWIWADLTHGNYVYAPAINPKPRAPQPSGELVEYVHIRWRYIEYAGHGPGHYALLRRRLDDLADRLARRIDGN